MFNFDQHDGAWDAICDAGKFLGELRTDWGGCVDGDTWFLECL